MLPGFPEDLQYTAVRVNGDFGVRMDSPSAGFAGILSLQVDQGEIVAVRIFSNPERFAGLAAPGAARRRAWFPV